MVSRTRRTEQVSTIPAVMPPFVHGKPSNTDLIIVFQLVQLVAIGSSNDINEGNGIYGKCKRDLPLWFLGVGAVCMKKQEEQLKV